MATPLRIGLTGGIASGKSTAAHRFQGLGVPVIDADDAARAVVAPGSAGLERVARRFGARVIGKDGELNRPALRNLIFSDAKARADLNAMLHPLIRTLMERQAGDAVGPYIVLAIPLLVEGGRQPGRVDRVLVIDVDEAVQLRRLAARDGATAEQSRAILAAQATRAARLNAADDVIANEGTIAELSNAVDLLHERYLQLAREKQGLP